MLAYKNRKDHLPASKNVNMCKLKGANKKYMLVSFSVELFFAFNCEKLNQLLAYFW